MMATVEIFPGSGFFFVPGFLSKAEQQELRELARSICVRAPLMRPSLSNGQPFRMRLTNAGRFGWWSDCHGYRYVEARPGTARLAWPPIPQRLLDLAGLALDVVGLPPMRIDNCLINHYDQGDALGVHIDQTEQDLAAPIVSMSIGADAEFILQRAESDDKKSVCIQSGDLVVQSGASRLWPHSIKRIMPTMTNILRDGGRLNFTMRKVLLP